MWYIVKTTVSSCYIQGRIFFDEVRHFSERIEPRWPGEVIETISREINTWTNLCQKLDIFSFRTERSTKLQQRGLLSSCNPNPSMRHKSFEESNLRSKSSTLNIALPSPLSLGSGQFAMWNPSLCLRTLQDSCMHQQQESSFREEEKRKRRRRVRFKEESPCHRSCAQQLAEEKPCAALKRSVEKKTFCPEHNGALMEGDEHYWTQRLSSFPALNALREVCERNKAISNDGKATEWSWLKRSLRRVDRKMLSKREPGLILEKITAEFSEKVRRGTKNRKKSWTEWRWKHNFTPVESWIFSEIR